MEIFNSFYDFFGFDLLAESATFIDLINHMFQVGLALFIVCFFLKSIFALMLNMFNTKMI